MTFEIRYAARGVVPWAAKRIRVRGERAALERAAMLAREGYRVEVRPVVHDGRRARYLRARLIEPRPF